MPNNDSGFLGGGPQFNKVGAGVTDKNTPEAVAEIPKGLQPYQKRNIVIGVIAFIMLIALFLISDPGIFGGIGHKAGAVKTVDPSDHTEQAPANF